MFSAYRQLQQKQEQQEQAVIFLTCIWGVPISNPLSGLLTIMTENFRGFLGK
jgi:hypothetical protein